MGSTPGKTHPSEVFGKFRAARVKVSGLLVVVFLVLPWIKVGGQPALLLNVVERKFSLFGFLFSAQDTPLLLFISGMFVFGIMLVTAVFGRAWCGWACPQTVFVDRVFRLIEKWVEGDSVSRRRLDASPLDLEKIFKKSTKWFVFFIVGAVISHSFLAYFVGTEELSRMVRADPAENPAAFLVMISFLGFTLFNFGWFRERFCTHVCPYGRLQTVLLDEDSWVVAYDTKRGEPRRGLAGDAPVGDCISCNKCVTVCPTGIDIREGLQLECIACTGCMDACDSVMKKIGKAPGLIRYSTMRVDREGLRPVKLSVAQSLFRARPILYFSIFAALILGFTWVLMTRKSIGYDFMRATGSPFEEIYRTGLPSEITNRFNVDFQNLTFERQTVFLEAGQFFTEVQIISPNLPLGLAPGERKRISVFFRFPKTLLSSGRKNILVSIRGKSEATEKLIGTEEVHLVGPY